MNHLPGEIDQLVARIESLERRVSALERQPLHTAAPRILTQQSSAAATIPSLDSISVFSVLGRAMLGIAGAYLLRAAAQSSLIPSQLAAAIAIPYAIAWLILAIRTRTGAWFPAIIYSSTSALILAPMLWELTFRFQILAAPADAAVIALYVCAATILAWRRNLTPVLWIANTAAILLALGLFLASRSTTPFNAVLLFMLALAAFAEFRNRAPGLRALTALAASATLWATVYIYISPPGTRTDYPVLSPAVLILPAFILFALYLASVLYNDIVRHKRITVFEIIETVIAFLLAAIALDAFGPPASLIFFGVLCLILAAAGYATVYLFFDQGAAPRNYRVFSTWSAALVLTGNALAFPAALQSVFLSLAAIVATILGARSSRFALVLHGTTFLATAAAVSGLAAYIVHALAGALPTAPAWPVYVAFFAAILCYFAMPRTTEASWRQQILQLAVAALAIAAAAAILVHISMALAAMRIQTGAHHLAFFRTAFLCVAALALAWAGARFSRVELTRIANAALLLLAVKLIAEDLRHGRLAYIAASIFLFALTLIAVPRVARHARAPHSTA